MSFFMGRSAPTPRNVVDVERAASDVPKTRKATDDTLMLLHERIVGGIFPIFGYGHLLCNGYVRYFFGLHWIFAICFLYFPKFIGCLFLGCNLIVCRLVVNGFGLVGCLGVLQVQCFLVIFRLQGMCGLARRFVGTPKPQDLGASWADLGDLLVAWLSAL